MNKFLYKISYLILIVTLIYGALGFLADGYTDPFYLRLTTPKQKSMIIGTSRAAQGIIPMVMNKKLAKGKVEGDIFNYGFTIIHSPYGKVYYHAIDQKLDKSTKNGLFILAVDPWAFCTNTTDDVKFRESKHELARITIFNNYPNYDYLRNAYKKSMFELIMNKYNPEKILFLHDDGWLEVTVDTLKEKIKASTKSKIANYKKQSVSQVFSKERFAYFIKTVELLKKHGTVIFVRVPVSEAMLSVENNFFPHFDKLIIDVSKQKNIKFLNYQNDNYLFIDGNHLHKSSSRKFTEKLTNDINKILLNE